MRRSRSPAADGNARRWAFIIKTQKSGVFRMDAFHSLTVKIIISAICISMVAACFSGKKTGQANP